MTTTGYRITYALLAVALIVIVVGALMFIPSGDPKYLPDAVETYAPQDGDIVINPAKVVLDLQPGYTVSFVIDGVSIPDGDVDSIVETGRYQFEPAEGKAIVAWTPGSHTVVATWIGGTTGTEGGTVVWTFRVQ